jgi:enterochelin esterase family protein
MFWVSPAECSLTPPDYNNSDNKYPVFYLLHGAGGDEDAWTNMGRTAQIMDNLIAGAKLSNDCGDD